MTPAMSERLRTSCALSNNPCIIVIAAVGNFPLIGVVRLVADWLDPCRLPGCSGVTDTVSRRRHEA